MTATTAHTIVLATQRHIAELEEENARLRATPATPETTALPFHTLQAIRITTNGLIEIEFSAWTAGDVKLFRLTLTQDQANQLRAMLPAQAVTPDQKSTRRNHK